MVALPPKNDLLNLRPAMAAAAQRVYDAWHQDADGEDVDNGFGGICQDIAHVMANVLSGAGIDAITLESSVGEQHVFVIAKAAEGVYEVDIPYSRYETGSGYVWKKVPDVQFTPDDITIGRLSKNPDDYALYAGDDPDYERYMKGGCHVLATSLCREYGFEYLLLVDRANLYPSGMPAIVHVLAVDGDDNAYDYMGKHSADDVRRQWTFADGNPDAKQECVSLPSEEELLAAGYVGPDAAQPLAPYTDVTVTEALAAAQKRLGNLLPSCGLSRGP